MISATDIELRAGSELLLTVDSLRIGQGDRIGLVGRNGAGKTTLMRTLSGEGTPAGGSVTSRGSIGYLPQDPRAAEVERTCLGSSARGARARGGHAPTSSSH